MKTVVGLILGVALLVGGGAAQAFDEKHVKKLKAAQTGKHVVWCKGCDLSEAVFEGAKLRKANLEGANFEKAILRRVDLSEANLTKANLSGAQLYGAILCKTKMPWGEDNSGCK